MTNNGNRLLMSYWAAAAAAAAIMLVEDLCIGRVFNEDGTIGSTYLQQNLKVHLNFPS